MNGKETQIITVGKSKVMMGGLDKNSNKISV